MAPSPYFLLNPLWGSNMKGERMMKKLVGLLLVVCALTVVGCGGPGKVEVPTDGEKMQTDTAKMNEQSNSVKIEAPKD
jgi:hypothetical protein